MDTFTVQNSVDLSEEDNSEDDSVADLEPSKPELSKASSLEKSSLGKKRASFRLNSMPAHREDATSSLRGGSRMVNVQESGG